MENPYKLFCKELIESGPSDSIISRVKKYLEDEESHYPPANKLVEWLQEESYELDNLFDHISRRSVDWYRSNHGQDSKSYSEKNS